MRLCNGAKLNVFQRAIEVELALRFKLHVTFDIRSIYRSKNSRARRKSTRDYHKNVIWQSRATYTTAWLFNHNYSSRNKAVLRLNYQNKEVILPSLKLWPDLMIPFLSKYPPLPYVPNGSLNVITTQAIRSRFQTVRKSSFPNLKKLNSQSEMIVHVCCNELFVLFDVVILLHFITSCCNIICQCFKCEGKKISRSHSHITIK